MTVFERDKIRYAGVESGARAHRAFRVDRRGFSLVELIIVLVIVAALATVAIPFFSDYMKSARNGRCVADLRTIDKAVVAYISDNGNPPSGNNLSVIGSAATLPDPWGRQYVYQNLASPGAIPLEDEFGMALNTDYDLYSLGWDGVSGPANTDAGGNDIARHNNGTFIGLRNPDAP